MQNVVTKTRFMPQRKWASADLRSAGAPKPPGRGAHPFRPLGTSLGLATYGGVRRKLGSAREYTYLSTNGVGEHSLIRLVRPRHWSALLGMVGYQCPEVGRNGRHEEMSHAVD